jgi:hypothetical protein
MVRTQHPLQDDATLPMGVSMRGEGGPSDTGYDFHSAKRTSARCASRRAARSCSPALPSIPTRRFATRSPTVGCGCSCLIRVGRADPLPVARSAAMSKQSGNFLALRSLACHRGGWKHAARIAAGPHLRWLTWRVRRAAPCWLFPCYALREWRGRATR